MVGRCSGEPKGSVNLARSGPPQDELDIIHVYTPARHDHNAVPGGANQMGKGGDAIRSPSLTCRGEYSRGSGLDDGFQASVHILALVKGTMESNRKGMRHIHQRAGPRDI